MRAAGVLLLCCTWLAGAATAQPSDPAGAGETGPRIYGVEIESSPERDRLLVFADGLLRPRLEPVSRVAVDLVFPGARLDPTAPRRVEGDRSGVLRRVAVFEQPGDPPEVRMRVARKGGASPRLSQRGGQVALDFEATGQATRAEPGPAPGRTLEARWLGLQLPEAVQRLARFLELTLILDPETVRGVVSIEAPAPLTVDEAASLLDSILLLKGAAAVKGPGGALKVVPIVEGVGRFAPTLGDPPDGELLVTLVRLEDVDAQLVAQALEPLVGPSGLITVHAPSNALLLGGPEVRLARLVGLLRALDATALTRLVLIPLRHADVETTAGVLETTFEYDPALRIWPDVRTGRLIVRARQRTIDEIRDTVARIDRPADGRGAIQVVPVRYADPERLATLLADLAAGEVVPGVRGAFSLAGRDLAVSIHGPTHSLVVQSDPETIDLVRDLVSEIDRRPRRVTVEVSVSEVRLTTNLALGFEAIAPLIEPRDQRDLIAAVVLSPSGDVLDPSVTPDAGFVGRIGRSPLLVPLVDPVSGIPILDPITGDPIVLEIPRETALVTADASEVRSRMLMRPRLSLLSGEEHEIFVGDNVPVPQAATGGSTNPLRTSQTVERRDTGVLLRVQPTIPEEGPIQLELDIEVSAFAGSIAGGPTFIERTVEAVVRLEAGRTAVIASAALPSFSAVTTGVPWLKDLPFLGWLFRTTRDQERTVHLLVTASAVPDYEEADALTDWMIEALEESGTNVATGAGAASP